MLSLSKHALAKTISLTDRQDERIKKDRTFPFTKATENKFSFAEATKNKQNKRVKERPSTNHRLCRGYAGLASERANHVQQYIYT
jgi:hypothetical protein